MRKIQAFQSYLLHCAPPSLILLDKALRSARLLGALRSAWVRLIIAMFILIYGNAAFAQSTDGLMDTVKGIVNDPIFGSMLMSKASSFLSRKMQPPGYGAGSQYGGGGYGMSPSAPYDNGSGSQYGTQSGFGGNQASAAPSSGFYSIDQGAPLGGVGYARNLAAAIPGIVRPSLPNQPAVPFNAQPSSDNQMTITKRLAPAELKQLSQFDISVLIDRSGSMSTRDCPDQFFMGRSISRWEWCREQTSMLAQQTAGALPAGVAVVPFSSRWERFDNVSPQAINSIFNSSSPDGGTNLAGALKSELDRYFQDRDAGMRQRPLMIAIITDGVPDSKSAVRHVIEEARQRMVSPNEIRICFFLIGDDQSGEDFIDELVERFDAGSVASRMITRHPFVQVNQVGLPRSLAFATRE